MLDTQDETAARSASTHPDRTEPVNRRTVFSPELASEGKLADWVLLDGGMFPGVSERRGR